MLEHLLQGEHGGKPINDPPSLKMEEGSTSQQALKKKDVKSKKRDVISPEEENENEDTCLAQGKQKKMVSFPESDIDDTNGSDNNSPPMETEPSPGQRQLEEETPAVETVSVSLKEKERAKWNGWPGYNVFRMIVAVMKVGSIIGRKGELIEKMCEVTKAGIKVIDGPFGNQDRVVLITGKEEPDLLLSPAMDAAIRVFKCLSGLSESESDGTTTAFCSIRLLLPSLQARSLIGKQGSLIKSIQESSGASIRILRNDAVPAYVTQDEEIAELQGEAVKVLKALGAVLGHLRKFLVDQTVLPFFDKSFNTPVPVTEERQKDRAENLMHLASQPTIAAEDPLLVRKESLFLDHESQPKQRISSSPLHGQDPGLSRLRSSGLGRAGSPIVSQVAQTMQIPISYADDIIGINGTYIAFFQRASGAAVTVQESRGSPNEIPLEIKGTSLEVETAKQLIQKFVYSHKEPVSSSYGNMDANLRSSSYSQLGGSAYGSSSLPTQPYDGGYGSSALGGHGSFPPKLLQVANGSNVSRTLPSASVEGVSSDQNQATRERKGRSTKKVADVSNDSRTLPSASVKGVSSDQNQATRERKRRSTRKVADVSNDSRTLPSASVEGVSSDQNQATRSTRKGSGKKI